MDAARQKLELACKSIYQHLRRAVQNINPLRSYLDATTYTLNWAVSYYCRYGVLLIARLYFKPRAYVYEDRILDPFIVINNIKLNEYDALNHICDRLEGSLSVLNDFRPFADRIVDDISLKDKMTALFQDIRRKAASERTRIRNQTQFTTEDWQKLVENVGFNYLNNNSALRIFSDLDLIEMTEQSGELPPPVEFVLTSTKETFMGSWSSYPSLVGYEAAQNLVFNSMRRIISTLIQHPSTVTIDWDFQLSPELFDKIYQYVVNWTRPVIIGLGVNFPMYLWDDKRFQVKRDESNNNMIGTYTIEKQIIEMYDLSDWARGNSFLILDASAFGKLNFVRPVPASNFIVNDFVRASRLERNDDNNVLTMEFKFQTFHNLELILDPKIIKVEVLERF